MFIHILDGADIYSEVGTVNVQSMEAAAYYVGAEFVYDRYSYLPDDEYQEQYTACERLASETGVY